MFNNFFFFKTKKTVFLKKKKTYNYFIFKDSFKYKKLLINLPKKNYLNFKIKSVITPFYYAFFKLFFNFKKKRYKPKQITNV